MYDKIKFGQRIAELRQKRWTEYKRNQDNPQNPYSKFSCCKSQASFAEHLGVERRTIGKWELGTSTPSFEQVYKICETLETNIEYLLGAEQLTGFSPTVIAAHYSNINIDVIEYAQKDTDYLDFLNFFMQPKNCLPLIKSLSNFGWKSLLAETELKELSEPLKSRIINIFQQYIAFTPIAQINKSSFSEYVFSELPNSSFCFSLKKMDEKINIVSCLGVSRFKELQLDSESPDCYEKFMTYLIDYSFETLSNKEFLQIQKNNLGKLFVRTIEDYLQEQ